ncbi:replication associated protein [Bovine faeces associated circular DNA virus 2]|uniref:replication associated protein n=1 Tax=Bovine faeces associated circular DNA virus 2 TaxID=1843765 RepID=UPI0007C1D188|nr:replication associated protein [Bovine faeces associated circular DNA virus 2]ANC51561.1 replication associated protein [Bovine faeces associated circular DNA virus 2]
MSVRDYRSKNYLLTYPRCGLQQWWVLTNLQNNERIKMIIQYVIVAQENHQDGAEHIHVFLALTEPIRIKSNEMDVFDIVDEDEPDKRVYHCNIQSVKSPKDAIQYVKKNGHFITYGICPWKVPLTMAEKNELLQSKSLHELVESGMVSIFKIPQLQKAISILQNELGNVERQPPKVHWYYGSTGTGKTRTAYEEAKESEDGYWISHETGEWFDGYIGQGIAILDDIRAATWPLQKLLRLCDRYPIQVPIKGGFTWWRPREIYITAPGRPEDIYKNYTTGQPYDNIEQLNRRITEMIDFDSETEPIDQTLYWKG